MSVRRKSKTPHVPNLVKKGPSWRDHTIRSVKGFISCDTPDLTITWVDVTIWVDRKHYEVGRPIYTSLQSLRGSYTFTSPITWDLVFHLTVPNPRILPWYDVDEQRILNTPWVSFEVETLSQ